MELGQTEAEEFPSLFARSSLRNGLDLGELQMLPIVRILLRPIPIKCRPAEQHQGNRGRHRHENADEDFVEGEAVAGH